MNCIREAILAVELVKDLWKTDKCYGARKLSQTLTGEATIPVLIRTDQFEEGKDHPTDWWYALYTELVERGNLGVKTKDQYRMLIPGKVPLQDTFTYDPPVILEKSSISGSSTPRSNGSTASSRTTLELYESGKSVPEIATQRGLKESTIGEHLIKEWTVRTSNLILKDTISKNTKRIMDTQKILDNLMGIVQDLKDGNKSALDVYPELNEFSKSVDSLRKELYDDVIEEASHYDKKEDIIKGNYKISIQSRSYPQYKEDDTYSFLDQKLKNRKKLIKKATDKGEPLTDPETGELISPVDVKFSTYPKCEFIGQQIK